MISRIAQTIFPSLNLIFTLLLWPTLASAAEGDLLWQVQFDKFGGNDSFADVATAENRVFVAGGTGDPSRPHPVPGLSGNSDFFVHAYDATNGTLLWEDVVVTEGPDDTASAIVAERERVFVGGDRSVAPGNFDFLIRTYNAVTGAFLWEDTVTTGSEFGLVRKIALDEERVFAISDNGLVRAYEAHTGRLVWGDKITNSNGLAFVGRDLAVDKKRVFAVGRFDNQTTANQDFFVRTYDADTGNVLWESRIDLGKQDDAIAVASLHNQIFVAGTGFPQRDFLVLSYQARKGFIQWEDRIDKNGESLASAITASQNRVFVGGIIEGSPRTYILVAYKAVNGDRLWKKKIDDAFFVSGRVLATSKKRVFVVGGTVPEGNPTNWHRFVRAYDSKSGNLQWSDQDTSSVSFFHTVVVDDQERLFAIGPVKDAFGNTDALMRVYDVKPKHSMEAEGH